MQNPVHVSELPNLTNTAAHAVAHATRSFPRDWCALSVCPSAVAKCTGTSLDAILSDLAATKGAQFYLGAGLVGRWDAEECFIIVKRTH